MWRISAVESSMPRGVVTEELLTAHRVAELSMHWRKVCTSVPRRTVDQIGQEREQLVAVWVEQAFPGSIATYGDRGCSPTPTN